MSHHTVTSRVVQYLLSLLIILIPLASCTEVPGPSILVPTEAAQPPQTLMPTITPLPSPPRVVRTTPAPGEEQKITEPLLIVFNQPVDPSSAERALVIEPEVKGRVSWPDDTTMRFVPESGFERDRQYRVTLKETLVGAQGLSTERPFSFEFKTVGYLEVTNVIPSPDSTDVATYTTIRISFNRPVVPLVGIGAQEDLPDPLTFEPPVEGSSRWVNTSIYEFEPADLLIPGMKYTVTVAEGLEDTTGGILTEAYQWSFTTEKPRISEVIPSDGAEHVAPKPAIRVTFSQPMDRAGVEERFSLLGPGDEPVKGVFSWDKQTLVFRPSDALERGAEYKIQLAAGSPAASGEAVLEEPFTSVFRVAELPRVMHISDPSEEMGPAAGPIITFSTPMDTTKFQEGLIIEPEANIYVYWSDEDTVAHISGDLQPSTKYTLRLTKKILSRLGEPLVEEATHTFTTNPLQPSFYLDVGGQVAAYSAYGDQTIVIRATNVETLQLRLYTISPEEFVSLVGEGGWEKWDSYFPRTENLVQEWELSTKGALNKEVQLLHPLGKEPNALPSGLYYLHAYSPQTSTSQRHLLVVTQANAVLKATSTEALVWLTDLRGGEPLPGMTIQLLGAKGETLGTSTTDGDGIASFTYPQQDPWAALFVVLQEGYSTTIHLRDWTRGIEPWSFDFPFSPYMEEHRVLFYTDRSIYRPGQTVHFKGIIRQDDDGRYSLPGQDEVAIVRIQDSEGRDVFAEELRPNDMGTISGEMALGQDAALGYYRVEVQLGGEYYAASFSVAEYRKPEFQVSLITDAEEYIQGQVIRAEAQASYYFGGPVANAEVHWTVTGSPYWFDRFEGEGHFSFSDYPEPLSYYVPSGAAVISEGRGHTDGEGRFSFSVPTDLSDKIQSQVYMVEAAITDINNQQVSAGASVIVHKGSLYIGLAPEGYVGSVGNPQQIDVVTVRTDGSPLPTVEVEVTLYQQEWYTVREKAEDGRFYWKSGVRLTKESSETITTDSDGQARVALTPKHGGSYKVLGRAVDEHGNEVRSAASIWVSAREFVSWRRDNDDTFDLVADKDSYRPGDTAKIMVPSPLEGPVSALVTVERGRILEHKLITLETNSEQLTLPILPEYAPNVYFGVVLLRATTQGDSIPEIKLGYVNIPVSTEQQEITLTITPDHEGPYKPREKITLEVTARDYQGRAVDTELSLKVVDRAVEALAGGDTTNIISAFYGPRPLGVTTSATLAALGDRIVVAATQEGKGGGGGEAEGFVRTEFPDTAYWDPTLRTGPDGRATITFTLPDNLTTWRVSAQGVTADTLVGMAERDVVSTLDLLVRPALPRFLVTGDEPVIAAVVHNNTDRQLDIAVHLDTQGLRVEGPDRQVTIPAQASAKLEWPAVTEAVSEATIRFTAAGGGLTDAVEITLPVYQGTSPETVGTAGEVEDQVLELVRVPEDASRDQGELRLRLEPSLAAGLGEALAYVETYPYECVEQTISRFLPNVVTLRTLGRLDIERPDLEARLPQLVGESLQRLYAAQNMDGGWGWWPGQRSNSFVTAYAVLGMSEAQKADLLVDARVLDNAIKYLHSWLDSPPPQTSDEERVFVLYVLAEVGEGDLGRTVALYDERHGLPVYTKALLASTLNLLQPEESSRLDTLANELADLAILSASGTYWEESEGVRWTMNTDIRTTAMVLRALLQVTPDSPMLSSGVRWLMTVREQGRWATTQENVWSILALTDYMAATGELEADYRMTLWLNGILEVDRRVTPETVDEPSTLQVPMTNLQPEGDNQIVIQRDPGPGRLYYSAFLHYLLPAEEMEPLNRGLIVQREYRLADGSDKPITEAATNDTVFVRLTVIAPNDVHYAVVEDPLPAGCEAIDTSLATTSQVFETPLLQRLGEEEEPWWCSAYRDWADHVELRDEKVTLFATYLPSGTYEYVYAVRCTTPGRYQVLPATAYEMYFPDTFGRSQGTAFTVHQAAEE